MPKDAFSHKVYIFVKDSKRKYSSSSVEHHTSPTVKHGGGSIMLLGCYSSAGSGVLVKIDGIMNCLDAQV